MDNETKYLILVQDPTTKKWSIAVDSVYEEHADRLLKNMRDTQDPSPVIKLCTGDYITINENPSTEGE